MGLALTQACIEIDYKIEAIHSTQKKIPNIKKIHLISEGVKSCEDNGKDGHLADCVRKYSLLCNFYRIFMSIFIKLLK